MEIEVAEVREAENLPLHASLPVRDDCVEPIAKLFNDHAGIHAFGGTNSSDGRTRRTGKEFQAKFRYRFASSTSKQLRIRYQLVDADGFDVFQRFSKSQQEG